MKTRFAKAPPANDGLGRSAEIELIRQLAREGTEHTRLPAELWTDPKSAFIIRPAAQWLTDAKAEPPLQALFGPLWMQGELCLLFADTNMGKSVLAVQIANSITRNLPIGPFALQASPQPVLYFDFELSARQFGQRYQDDDGRPYPFSPLLQRVVLNPDCTSAHRFKDYDHFLANGLENAIITSKARVVIIDNLSCLRSGTEGSTGAAALMQLLNTLKRRYRLSLLVLAHTPKRNPVHPISRNDMQGSKMLINFADSAFAIGESHTQPGTRYLKQVKQRSGREQYGAGNVCLCRLHRTHDSLAFDFTGQAPEWQHLMSHNAQQSRAQEEQVTRLHEQGLSQRQIAGELNLTVSSVHRTLKRLERQGNTSR